MCPRRRCCSVNVCAAASAFFHPSIGADRDLFDVKERRCALPPVRLLLPFSRSLRATCLGRQRRLGNGDPDKRLHFLCDVPEWDHLCRRQARRECDDAEPREARNLFGNGSTGFGAAVRAGLDMVCRPLAARALRIGRVPVATSPFRHHGRCGPDGHADAGIVVALRVRPWPPPSRHKPPRTTGVLPP